MKSTTTFALAIVATLGLAIIAVPPVVAQQDQMKPGGMPGIGQGMMGNN